MDGPVPDPRLFTVYRGFVPTRLSEDILSNIYERLFQRPIQEVAVEVLEDSNRVDSFVATGGRHE
jgi:hypothetical protein